LEFDEPAKEKLMAEIAERLREERLRAANGIVTSTAFTDRYLPNRVKRIQ